MKNLLITCLVTFAGVLHAEAFNPQPGTKISCDDSVSGYEYLLEIVDIGDEEGAVTEYYVNNYVRKYENVVFDQHSEGSFFVVYINGQSEFSIDFPENDLGKAFYVDRGDSRALDCRISE